MGYTGGDALASALLWVQSLLTGSLAQALAVIAFAGLGFAALSGRLSLRSAVRVTLGAFILFGAPSIAAGELNLAANLSRKTAPPHFVAPVPAPFHSNDRSAISACAHTRLV